MQLQPWHVNLVYFFMALEMFLHFALRMYFLYSADCTVITVMPNA